MELSVSTRKSSSHCLNPGIFSNKATRISLPRRIALPRRVRFSVSSNAADAAEAVRPSQLSLFWLPKKLTVQQKIVDVLTPPVRLASCVVLTGTAMAAGLGLWFCFGGGRAAGLGGAAMLYLVAGAAAFGINSSAPEVIAVNLRDVLAGYGDSTELKKEVVDDIVQKLIGDLLIWILLSLFIVIVLIF